jgi:hypothetical protein
LASSRARATNWGCRVMFSSPQARSSTARSVPRSRSSLRQAIRLNLKPNKPHQACDTVLKSSRRGHATAETALDQKCCAA